MEGIVAENDKAVLCKGKESVDALFLTAIPGYSISIFQFGTKFLEFFQRIR